MLNLNDVLFLQLMIIQVLGKCMYVCQSGVVADMAQKPMTNFQLADKLSDVTICSKRMYVN